MFLSVIMPVRNEGRHIGRTLGQLLSQDYDPAKFEIIVVDGESTDDTCDIVREIAESQQSEVGGQRSEVSSQKSEVRGQKSEVRDQRSAVRSRKSEARDQRSEVRDQRSEVRDQRSEVGGQRSEVGGQRSEVRGQRSEVSSQKSEVGGQRSEVSSQQPSGSPLPAPSSPLTTNDYQLATFPPSSPLTTNNYQLATSSPRPSITLLPNPKRLSSAARNIGIRHARGDAVLIVDGHCEIANDRMLHNLAEAFVTSGADCVGRPQPLDVTGATMLQRAIASARSSWLGHHPASYIYSSNAQFVPAVSVAVAYRRSVFERVGYFDESFDACEDYEFNHRCDKAGLRCYFTPEVAVRYEPRTTLRGLFSQLFRYGRGRVRLLRKHPETASLGALLPAGCLLGLLIGLPMCFVSGWLAVGCLAMLAVYLAVVLVVSVNLALLNRQAGLLFWIPLAFVVIHLASGAGVLAEAQQMLFNKRTP